jgi:YkoY family integral membrane protein
MYGQTFDQQDIATVALLIVLEGVLSTDNALVLALLAKRLPKSQQARALTYGLIGAFAFRFLAIGGATYLLRWEIVKLIGGGYLLWVALKHLLTKKPADEADHIHLDQDNNPTLVSDHSGAEISSEQQEEHVRARTILPLPEGGKAGFWPTVLVIELTDIAFAVDSILAAIAVVGRAPVGHEGPHPKLWVVLVGGMLGVVLMRVAATLFIKLLERFPRFETSAYLLVLVIGSKLLADWGFNSTEHPHRVDFHDTSSPAFWAFWALMALCIGYGFLAPKKTDAPGTQS